jgi:hypothetical protein
MDISYSDLDTKADAIKALFGVSPVYLRGSAPFEVAESCEPGGTHRLDIATSVWFYGTHPGTGIRVRWSFDIEPTFASGTGSYAIDTEACREAVRGLRGSAREQFREYLAECATKVRARGDEYRKLAERQAMDAAILSDLAATPA